jgi:hypothetical protein
MPDGTCSINDDWCSKSRNLRRGWCDAHYKRWYKHGDPLGPPLPVLPPSLPGELWRLMPGCMHYEISSLGRARSLPRRTVSGVRGGQILTPTPHGNSGYLAVGVSEDGAHANLELHRMVALAFLGPCPAGQIVRHGPNGKLDNRLSELCYGTLSENGWTDRIRDGSLDLGTDLPWTKMTEAIVMECRQRNAEGETQTALALEFGVSAAAMQKALTGESWNYLPGRVPITGQGGPCGTRTHCPQKHEYTEANTYITPKGARMCRTCSRDQKRKARAEAKKQAA